jgi:hypothetical protein
MKQRRRKKIEKTYVNVVDALVDFVFGGGGGGGGGVVVLSFYEKSGNLFINLNKHNQTSKEKRKRKHTQTRLSRNSGMTQRTHRRSSLKRHSRYAPSSTATHLKSQTPF